MAELDGKAVAKALGDLIAERDALKAEVERLNTWHSTLSESWKARAEKAEAEVERLNKRLKDMTANRDYWEDKADGTERDRAEKRELKRLRAAKEK